jgi:hypothetical protein
MVQMHKLHILGLSMDDASWNNIVQKVILNTTIIYFPPSYHVSSIHGLLVWFHPLASYLLYNNFASAAASAPMGALLSYGSPHAFVQHPSMAADGLGTRGRSWWAPNRCGLRWKPGGGPGWCGSSTRFSSRAVPHHSVPQPTPALTSCLLCHNSTVPQPWSWPGVQIACGEVQFTPSLSITCTIVYGRLVYSCGH